jgi:hypothetical protein
MKSGLLILPDKDTANLAMLLVEDSSLDLVVDYSLVLVEDSSLDLVGDYSLVLVEDSSLDLVVDSSLVLVGDMVLAMAMVLEESLAAVVVFLEETESQDIKKHQFICLAVLNKQ